MSTRVLVSTGAETELRELKTAETEPVKTEDVSTAEKKLEAAITSRRRSSFRQKSFASTTAGIADILGDDLHAEADEIDYQEGLVSPLWKNILFVILFPTILVPLIVFWSPRIRKALLYSKHGDLRTATYLLARSAEDQEVFIEKISNSVVDGEMVRTVAIRCKKYILFTGQKSFIPIPDSPPKFTSEFLDHTKKKNNLETNAILSRMRNTYGDNVMAMPPEPYHVLFINEAFQPFYVFQYFSCALWIYEKYWTYTIVIFLITSITVTLNVFSVYSTKNRLREMANLLCEIDLPENPSAFSNGDFNSSKKIDFNSTQSNNLVPGTYIIVRAGQVLTCDAVLVQGECIVDENILTGETLPVRKVPFEPAMVSSGIKYNPVTHAGFTLYSGTTVKLTQGVITDRKGGAPGETQSGAIAIVCRTGFASAKGQLLRTIMFPMHHDLQYAKDAVYFIAVMGIFGSIVYIWSAIMMVSFKATPLDIFVKFLDMISISVPPALAAALSIATSVSVSRLTKQQVFVSASERVNWAGLINAVCFDKTGTLTQSGLDFDGVVPAGSPKAITDVSYFDKNTFEMLATCHGLSMLEGKLVGDPLEVRLFETSGSVLVQTVGPKGPVTNISKEGRESWTIDRRFDFASEKMRSGVVCTRVSTGKKYFHVKGSPEAIAKIVKPDTLPADYSALLTSFTRLGLRVLAFAVRPIQEGEDVAVHTDQVSLEVDGGGMQYGGLILLANKLKAETAQTIKDLKDADIKVAMITGDHIRTAVAVSYNCGILQLEKDTIIIDLDEEKAKRLMKSSTTDLEVMVSEMTIESLPLTCIHTCKAADADSTVSLKEAMESALYGRSALAISGRALKVISEAKHMVLFSFIIGKADVFARMEPEDKSLVVETLTGGVSRIFTGSAITDYKTYYAAFCGDGANDIAALKSSMVGVSLCDAEASVAAPLTSKNQSPSIMINILLEGRCSLAASFSIFKYIMAYACIQVMCVSINYSIGLKVGDLQYLFHDLFFTTIMAAAMAFGTPATKLPRDVPPERFITPAILGPVFVHFIIIIGFQFAAWLLLRTQKWFVPFDPMGQPASSSFAYENTALFIVALAQYITAALVMDTNKPFRKPFYANWRQLICILYQAAIVLYLIFGKQYMDLDCKQGMMDSDPDGTLIPSIYKSKAYDNLPELLLQTNLTSYTAEQNATVAIFTACDAAITNHCAQTLNYTDPITHVVYPGGTIATFKCLIDYNNKDWWMDNAMEVKELPDSYRLPMLGLVVANFIVAVLADMMVKGLITCYRQRQQLRADRIYSTESLSGLGAGDIIKPSAGDVKAVLSITHV